MRYNRTQASRSCYAACAFTVTALWPLWLKLMTIINDTKYSESMIFDPNSHIEFTEWGGNDNYGCTTCASYTSAVRYPVSVNLKNLSQTEDASYVVLFASLDYKYWWQTNTPSVLNVVNKDAHNSSDGQDLDICKIPEQLTKAPSSAPTLKPTISPVPTIKPTTLPPTLNPTEANRRRNLLMASDDLAENDLDEYALKCCLGVPGQTYLVACVVTDFNLWGSNQGEEVDGPPFDNRCIAVGGVCGGTCDSQVKNPSKCDKDTGTIPMYELVENRCYKGDHWNTSDYDDDNDWVNPHKSNAKYDKNYFDEHDDIDDDDFMACGDQGEDSVDYSEWVKLPVLGWCHWADLDPWWRWSFMCMMFMSWISMSAASLPGIGVCGSADERLPILHTLNHHGAIDSGAKCISFSISASEHKLWVLRNLLGKLSASFLHPNAVLYDYFQDEKARAGCFAVWDALVRFINVEEGDQTDTIGFCRAWSARLRDPADILRESGQFTSNQTIKMSEIEAGCDAFQGIDILADRYGVSEAKLAELHYAYELYELIENLGDRRVWTGWDPDEYHNGGFQSESDLRATFEKYSNETQHVDGFRDWLQVEDMYDFARHWAESLTSVAVKSHKKVQKIDPFDNEVLKFCKEREVKDVASDEEDDDLLPESSEVKIGAALHFFGDDDDESRFKKVHKHYKKTSGQALFDFIDERIITVGAFNFGIYTTKEYHMIYSTRAKPENKDFSKLANERQRSVMKKRILIPGVYACLKTPDPNEAKLDDFELESYPPGKKSQLEHHRACYGKVKALLPSRTVNGKKVKFIQLSKLSQPMIDTLPYLLSKFVHPTEENATGGSLFSGKSSSSTQDDGMCAELPESILEPLLRCRGKAGGMNYAVKIIQARQHKEVMEKIVPAAPALTLFAIFDCRHMVTPGFWEQTILHFFREKNGQVSLYSDVKYCQVPQNFIGVDLETDYLDMQNEFLFRYVNCIRDGVGAVTSCGTNCVWSIEAGFEYEEKTMIEDTATSHKVILQGYEGTYHYEKLIFGTPKENKDFLAAIFRWSRGAVQLFWLSVLAGERECLCFSFFWIVLLLVVVPMALVLFGMQLLEGSAENFVYSMALFLIYFVAVGIAFFFVTTRKYAHYLRYIVLFDNCTYFFNTFPAYYWALVLPGWMCFKGEVPFSFNFFWLVPGGLLWEVLTYIQVVEVKKWSIVEGRRPEDISILRSQQMYFVNCPLHAVALYSGTKSAYRIIFHDHDASSWSSFGGGGPGDWILNWLHFLVAFETACIVSVFVQCGLYGIDDATTVLSFAAGMFTAALFLILVFDPYCILFCGMTKTLTLKHAYLGFWFMMLVIGLVAFLSEGYISFGDTFV